VTASNRHGALLIGQAGGATAVINRSLAGVIREARACAGFVRVLGMRRAVEGALQDEFIDLSHLPEAHLERVAHTPGAALASSRHKITDDELEALLDICRARDVSAFLYIGGNDSADTVHRLAAAACHRGQELQAIAIPKTIDNDLPCTDHSPGYGSIARYIAIATRDSAMDTESMPTMYPVKFVEVMGRDAGWVAAASALGKRKAQDAPHLIYVPELPASRAQIVADVRDVHAEFGYCVAVVTETLRDETGRSHADPSGTAETDRFGHPLIRGTADALCRLVQTELGLRARYDKPGSLQRMSMLCASSTDLQEAEAVGRAAVRLALAGETDRMVTLERTSNDPYTCVTGSTPLKNVANQQFLLPGAFLNADGRGVTDEFRSYAMPLVGPEPLPVYARLPL